MTNYFSRLFGKIASYPFPKPVQKIINQGYVKLFDIDLSEFDEAQNYKTLNALFTRELKQERKFDISQNSWISPCDSLVMEKGEIQHNVALQIKGMSYCVSEFLGSVLEETHTYLNLYLSPKDYHRFHAPCDMEILEVRYFAGELLPVNLPSLLKNHNLFIRNERVVIVAKDSGGNLFYYVAVGALNVGKMLLHFEPRLHTNAKANTNTIYSYSTPIFIKKGQEIGLFQMGSTIVLFASNVNFGVQLEQKICFGDTIGYRR